LDQAEYVHKRKRKYMAQVRERFEVEVQALLPESAAGAVQDFKGLVRARMNALATDAVEIMQLGDERQNGLALDIRDRLT
jgi:hypothetical protein